jgi:short chain dehydrogenase
MPVFCAKKGQAFFEYHKKHQPNVNYHILIENVTARKRHKIIFNYFLRRNIKVILKNTILFIIQLKKHAKSNYHRRHLGHWASLGPLIGAARLSGGHHRPKNPCLEALQQENPKVFVSKTLDLNDRPKAIAQLEALNAELGDFNLFIICAGIGEFNPNLDFEIEKRTIDTNVLGFTAVADWAFAYFQKQASGHLVGISSVGGLRGNRQAPAYNASKAFQINYMEGLRQKAQHLKSKILVTDIRPGLVATAKAMGCFG